MRPPLPREMNGFRPFQNAVLVDPSQQVVTLSENLSALSNNGVENGIVSVQLGAGQPPQQVSSDWAVAYAAGRCCLWGWWASTHMPWGCAHVAVPAILGLSRLCCWKACTDRMALCWLCRCTAATGLGLTECMARIALRMMSTRSRRAQQCRMCCRCAICPAAAAAWSCRFVVAPLWAGRLQ